MEGERSLAMRSRAADRCRSMDVLCDTLMVEEILPRLSPKSLIRLGAVSRRYNAIVLDPDFAARYWRRSGVFFQPFQTTRCMAEGAEPGPLFLSSSRRPPAGAENSMFGADLTFLPAPSMREKAYLRQVGDPVCAGSVAVIVHSAAGLLLCSRGRVHPAHYYVCNPVSGQWVALPELPCPSKEWQSGLLKVDTDGDAAKKPNKFKVLLFNHPMHWRKPGGCFDLRLFSSDTGLWKTVRLNPPTLVADIFSSWSPIGQSGSAYWIVKDQQAVVYNSDKHSVEVIKLPPCLGNGIWRICIGERHGGGLRYAISNASVFDVWFLQTNGGGDSMWMLAHRVGIAQLLEQNPEAADFMLDSRMSITPLGFHSTDDNVVFLGVSGKSDAVAAYSIENGIMSLHQLTSSCLLRSTDMFPYVHPPYLVQIPAIKNSISA
ncbi:unnamed protein product [Urochloa decumbens]|uniref:F-box protein At3g26010-like beta-propeller domain-containing protein n=1 Tax=Urochloa decumbens TaxID=240449 RepID=A0ABC8YWP0_9POAL